MNWKRGKEEEGQAEGAEGVEGAEAEEVAAVVHRGARGLDHHRGARGLGQEVGAEVAAEVEAVDAQCKPENRTLSLLLSSSCNFLSNNKVSTYRGPSYGGGKYYGGGAATPYKSGGRSPGGILPYALGGGLLGAALIFPGLWLYGAYAYNYNHPYSFRNRTRNNFNETLPVTCLCERYSACGCDDANNSTFLDGIIGDGNLANLNKSLVNVGNVNGTKTIVLNGTLPNDTVSDATTTAGDATGTGAGAATNLPSVSAANKRFLLETSGFWLLGAIVAATVWFF